MTSRITHTFGARLRRSLNLSTAMVAVAVMSASGVAMAQEAAPAAQTMSEAVDDQVQEVVVVGTRSSLQSAMNRKKRAGTVSDSIVAEDIGQFPDKNVGEALGRVTGVQLSRDMGEGSAVSIRGVEPDLNRIEINGMSVLSTAGNLNVYGGGGRSNDFRELPSEMVKSIDVFKGFTADMTEGGIGGTVSVQTRKPLDFKKPTFSITASAQNLDTMDGWKPRTSLFGATQLFDGKLGLMGSLNFDKVVTRGDYYDDHSWARLADFDNSDEKTVSYFNQTYGNDVSDYISGFQTEASCASIAAVGTLTATQARTACESQWYDYQPRVPRYRVWTRDDNRSSGEFTAQYKFNDQMDAFVTYQKNKRTQVLNDINYGTDFTALNRLNYGSACNVTVANAGAVPGVVVDENHNVTEYVVGNCLGTTGRGGNNAFSVSSRDFQYESSSEYVSYGFNYNGERWTVKFQGSNGETETLSETNNVSVSYNTPGLKVTIDPNGSAPIFTFADGYSPSDASAVSQWQIQYRPSQSANSEDQYKLDFEYRAELPFLKAVKFGGRMTDATTSGYGYGGFIVDAGANLGSVLDNTVIYANSVNSTALVSNGATADQTEAVYGNPYETNFWNTTETWSRGFSNQIFAGAMTPLPSSFYYGGGGLPTDWLYPTFNGVAQYLDTSHFNLDNLYTTTGSDGKPYDQIPYNIQEKTDAQYVRFDYAFPAFGYEVDGNFGVRRVHTETTATGQNTRRETRDVNGTATTGIVSNTLTSMTKDYTVWLPSFNINTWLIDNELSVRAGFAKLMARPLVNFLQPSIDCTINYSNDVSDPGALDSCNAGNPGLKPYRADQFDLSFEWYPNRDTQLSAGFFHKNIRSFYISSRTSLGPTDVFGDGVIYDYNTYVNGSGAKISGLELTAKTAFTFLPGWLSGFGADANYTYQEAKDVGVYSQLDGSELPYPGLSSDSYNLTFWYDKGPINARLAYNYRSEYLVTAADVSLNPIFKDPTGYLDGKITWKPGPEGLSFFAEGKNLTEEDESTWAGDIRLINTGYSGRRFFVGMTIKR
ncbi:TonB-dependent receptor [Asticcacaulis endophyticus]|uniref:TonB-dependent receptor n=1 Tax=Asticcacaulis endophyticus TaxID=1395890 RepID=A0A918UY49_9CAUL|nr:TonB-dependent receptor [Asticcacaulis endophyticus]GGZ41478.1 TonB-dependent receptor [Asticcacaulis endophyticus]